MNEKTAENQALGAKLITWRVDGDWLSCRGEKSPAGSQYELVFPNPDRLPRVSSKKRIAAEEIRITLATGSVVTRMLFCSTYLNLTSDT
jgi:hypothetical protein